MTRSGWLLLLSAAAAWSLPALVRGVDIHVAPGGKDSWSGRLERPTAAGDDGPLATIPAARDAARRLDPAAPRRIIIHSGTYRFVEPLALGPADSSLTIEAPRGEQAVLSGGRQITGWKRDGDFWSVDLPEVARGQWDFRLLVVNGRFAPRARLPQQGFLKNLNEYKVPGPDEPQRKPSADALTHMI